MYVSDGAYVDIGGRSAFVPLMELRSNLLGLLCCRCRKNRTSLIIRDQDAEGQVTLSRRQLEIQQIWVRLVEMR